MLNNSELSDVEGLDTKALTAVSEEALQNVSRFIVLDKEDDLPIGRVDCFQQVIWETGAFVAGRRDRLPRAGSIDLHDAGDPATRIRVGLCDPWLKVYEKPPLPFPLIFL